MNTLYYGNNLNILREHIADKSVDLIYLDPPFQSGKNYNILFQEHDGGKSKAQIQAFEDTWHWEKGETQATYEEIIDTCPDRVVKTIAGFYSMLGTSDMMSYLVMMAIRLVELQRVLKDTGSIFLHCDPTASHYLKIVMDAVFGSKNFRNEIVWHYKTWQGQVKDYFPKKHDVILFYTKTDKWKFDLLKDKKTIEETIDFHRWNKFLNKNNELTGNSCPKTDSRFNGYLKRWIKEHGREPQANDVLLKIEGLTIDSVWDLKAVDPKSSERLGYVTQKPEALLERIIKASSNEGDILMDPFAGCGTLVSVAQRLKRKWIGIDITHLAIGLIKERLNNAFGEEAKYQVIGEPTDVESAHTLKEQNTYQFQCWAVNLIGGRPTGQGGDKGIDGYKYFRDPEVQQMLISVKSGHVTPAYVRDLKGTVSREKASVGILITLEEPTREMRKESASAGFYQSPLGSKHPKIQILTIKELLEGKKVDFPQGAVDMTFKKAERKMNREKQKEIF